LVLSFSSSVEMGKTCSNVNVTELDGEIKDIELPEFTETP